MILDNWTKSAWEEITIAFDVSASMATGDTIASADIVVLGQNGDDVSDTMAVATEWISGTTVSQKITAGTDGQNYLAKLRVTTADGDKFEDTLNIRVRDDAAEIFKKDRGSLGEYKRLMRIATDDHDDALEIMIPAIKNFVMERTRNNFKARRVTYTAETIAFVAGTPPTITDTASGFVEYYMASATDIIVEGSLHNDRLFYCTTAAAGTLTLAADEDVIAEAAGNSAITITRVQFPQGLKLIIASMLGHLLKQMSFTDSEKEVSGETIGDYTVRYRTVTGDDFPESTLKMLNSFRKVGLR